MTARSEHALFRLLKAMRLHRVPLGEALRRLHEAIARAGTLTIAD